jgi:hypothetical protein
VIVRPVLTAIVALAQEFPDPFVSATSRRGRGRQ